jgi:hypothetical protein
LVDLFGQIEQDSEEEKLEENLINKGMLSLGLENRK